jgi:hypothetical protein
MVMLLAGAVLSVSAQAQAPQPPYDSVQQEIIDGNIDDGVILVKPGTEDPLPLIRAQLKYTLGQLNWWDAAPKLSWFKIEVGKADPMDDDTGLIPVHYKAQGHISWSKDQESLSKLPLVLPARGDKEGIHSFVKRYFKRCTNDPHADEKGYFFFFYPRLKTCPMSHSDDDELESEKGMVVRFPMHFEKNDSNTEGKYPEYGKLWEDHKLTVTAIFGKVEPEATTDADEGIRGYNKFYSMMINRYGRPSSMNDSFSGGPGNAHRRLKMVWKNGNSKIELHLALVSALSRVGQSFLDWYRDRTQDSDVIVYSGHAGLGDNVEVLVKNAVFQPKKYQIFFVNGCDTFTYVNEELFAAHAAATPGAPVSKYLDIITNSVSNYFASMPNATFTLVKELVRKKKTYHEILDEIDPRQRAIVDGEEDNTWPESFEDWKAPGEEPRGAP